ncbi:unnamed protein product [Brassica oleracea]
MMMKQAQTILVKYCRKGISSIASSPMSTRVKHAWEEQDKLVLGLAFIGGWFVKANINVLKRREDWYRVHRFIDDEKKRLEGKRARIEKIRAVYSTEVTLFNNKFGTKIPNLETLGSPIRRGQKKMLPFLGNTLAKSCRKGRLQCRDFSSGSEKAVSKVYRYCFTAVFGGAGFLLGGVTTSPVSKGLREYEERFVKGLQRLEIMEARRGKWTSSLKEETK